ncbi:unnamed protein product [Leptosia nina]|uniref:Peptidase S1 domain-containing protein n=1 Tax=Leptosia nina TaxID=320188 RepID=A0AAV1JZR4_9NEOP
MKIIQLLLPLCLVVLECRAQSSNSGDAWLLQNLNKKKGPNLSQTGSPTSCTTDNKSPGKCVKPAQCQQQPPEIDLEKLGILRDKHCHYLKMCCPLSQVISGTTVTPAPPAPKKSGCGWSNPGVYAFRAKTQNHAEFGEFPWMIALIRKSSSTWSQSDYLGGGTLIHKSVVMTAAHKVKPINYQPSMVICRLGEWDTQTTNEQYAHEDKSVKKIIVHEQFNSKLNSNNIALLITTSEFDLSPPHVGIACLGRRVPQPGTNCYSMGWGKDFNNNMEYAVWLKKVSIPLVEHSDCEYSLQQSLLGGSYRLHNTHLCAGGNGQDTCKGDGGSSLVCKTPTSRADPDRYVVYGMVSFGVDCKGQYPAVYADVSKMITWISNKFQDEGLDLSFLP